MGLCKKSNVKDYLDSILQDKSYRSVKKALYTSFNNSIQEYSTYNPDNDILILSFFSNIDYIVRLLEQKKRSLQTTFTLQLTLIPLGLLKKYYTQKQIFNLYYKSSNYHTSDILWVIQNIITGYGEEVFLNNFKKVRCNSKLLHDEVVRVYNSSKKKKYENVIFEYDSNAQEIQSQKDGLIFVLPKNR